MEEQVLTPENTAKSELLETLVPVLIAIVSVLTALTAMFQSTFSSFSDAEALEADKLSIRKTQTEIVGALEYSYHWQGIFQIYDELDMLRISAEQRDDPIEAERYAKLLNDIRPLSPILNGDLFDEESGYPKTDKYKAELYLVETARLEEEALARYEISDQWGEIAHKHVNALAFYGVALALYGLVSTVQGRMRWVFVAVASLLVLYNLVLTVGAWSANVSTLSMDAINAYAEGIGNSYQGNSEAALDNFNAAIAAKPDYGQAYNRRGDVQFELGNYAAAAEDYQLALENGLAQDTSVQWNLSWTYYLLGKFDEAAEINAQMLANDSSLYYLRFDQALIKAANGDIEGAREEYDLALQEINQQVETARSQGLEAPSTLWYRMAVAAQDLESLLGRLQAAENIWTEAPALELIKGDAQAIAAFVDEQYLKLRQTVVALEYGLETPPEAINTQLTSFEVASVSTDSQGNPVYTVQTSFPAETYYLKVLFEYTGAQPGEQWTIKYYENGNEMDAKRNWGTFEQTSGSYELDFGYGYTNAFILPSGFYTAELYAGSKLIGLIPFTIE